MTTHYGYTTPHGIVFCPRGKAAAKQAGREATSAHRTFNVVKVTPKKLPPRQLLALVHAGDPAWMKSCEMVYVAVLGRGPVPTGGGASARADPVDTVAGVDTQPIPKLGGGIKWLG